MEDYKRETIDSYDKNAKAFSEKFKNLMDHGKRNEFQKFINLLKGKKILDLGSGGGDHAVYFRDNGLDVTCVDLSEGMLDLCREKGLNAIKMDIENLTFSENSFDGIWAVTSLLHVPKSNLIRVIEKLSKIIKKDGILYVCVKEGKGEEFVEDISGRRLFSYWNKDELIGLFESNFRLIDAERDIFGKTIYLKLFFRG